MNIWKAVCTEDLFCVGPQDQWMKDEGKNIGVYWITSGLDDL